jgi:uncharacterized protein
MTLSEQLQAALKDAMRAGDELTKRTLRMVISAIRLNEVEKGVKLDDAEVIAVLQKEVKSRHESIADAQKANRPDIEAESRAEIEVLEKFLPKAFSEAELEALVREAIAETGAASQKEMGKVMKVLIPRLQGRATGDQTSQMVRRLLES